MEDFPTELQAYARKIYRRPRLAAFFMRLRRYLGWSEIDVRVVNVSSIIEGERDENEVRKDFTPSERVAIADAVKAALGERRGGDRSESGSQSGQSSTLIGEKSRDIAAAKSGFSSGKQYERAKAVVETGVPELVEKMDTGEVSVSAAATIAKQPKDEQRRIVAEYDAAQERGEIRRHGGDQTSGTEDCLPCAADIGLTHKDVFEARQVRNAEEADPGIVRRTRDQKLDAGQEPTKAAFRARDKALSLIAQELNSDGIPLD